MGKAGWEVRADYLEVSRRCMWNEDYMRFLVEKVWKIDQPVHVGDFGCGIGFFGEFLMPLLPKGSRYTGIDISAALLERARKRLHGVDFEVDFEQADLTDYSAQARFDVAICQAVLMHIPNGLRVIDKMAQSVRPGGLVICCEISRNACNAGICFEGLDTDEFANLGILQKLWRADLLKTGADSNIGVKIPAYMRKIGLRDVDVRVNDYVHFVDPDAPPERHRRSLEAFLSAWGGGGSEREKVIANLMDRGLTCAEAEHQYQCEKRTAAHLQENAQTAHLLSPMFMLISYGRK